MRNLKIWFEDRKIKNHLFEVHLFGRYIFRTVLTSLSMVKSNSLFCFCTYATSKALLLSEVWKMCFKSSSKKFISGMMMPPVLFWSWGYSSNCILQYPIYLLAPFLTFTPMCCPHWHDMCVKNCFSYFGSSKMSFAL